MNKAANRDLPALSIIIISWNTRELLRDCLSSIVIQLVDILDHEIIVVDNASSDGSAEMVESEFKSARLVRNKENIGFARATNRGAKLARGKYLLLINSDSRLLDADLVKLVDYMDKHPGVGITTGRMLYEDRTFQSPYRRFPGILETIFRQTIRRVTTYWTPYQNRHMYMDLDPDKMHEVEWVTGAYLMVRRNLLDDMEVFDERIFMYYEDTLLCHRIWEKGFRVVYLPVAPLIHYRGQSARKVRVQAASHSFKSSVIYIQSVYSKRAASIYRLCVLLIWRLFFWIFRLIGFLRIGKLNEKAEFFRILLECNVEQ